MHLAMQKLLGGVESILCFDISISLLLPGIILSVKSALAILEFFTKPETLKLETETRA